MLYVSERTKLDRISKEVYNRLRNIGVPISNKCYITSMKSSRYWGWCQSNSSYVGYKYTIAINENLVKNGSDLEIAKTIAHEYLHTVPGGSSHTGEWKRWANWVNTVTDYNITRLSSQEEKGVELVSKEAYKYDVICNKCGKGYKYKRKSAVVKIAISKSGELTCGHCGVSSNDFTVKYL